MKNSEIVSRFNFAIETENKEVALFLFDILKENANEARAEFDAKKPGTDYNKIHEVVSDAQIARNTLVNLGAKEEMFSDCNF